MQRHRMTPTTFGLCAMNDSRFVFDLRNGRAPSLITVEGVWAFMAKHDAKQDAKRAALIERQRTDR